MGRDAPFPRPRAPRREEPQDDAIASVSSSTSSSLIPRLPPVFQGVVVRLLLERRGRSDGVLAIAIGGRRDAAAVGEGRPPSPPPPPRSSFRMDAKEYHKDEEDEIAGRREAYDMASSGATPPPPGCPQASGKTRAAPVG